MSMPDSSIEPAIPSANEAVEAVFKLLRSHPAESSGNRSRNRSPSNTSSVDSDYCEGSPPYLGDSQSTIKGPSISNTSDDQHLAPEPRHSFTSDSPGKQDNEDVGPPSFATSISDGSTPDSVPAGTVMKCPVARPTPGTWLLRARHVEQDGDMVLLYECFYKDAEEEQSSEGELICQGFSTRELEALCMEIAETGGKGKGREPYFFLQAVQQISEGLFEYVVGNEGIGSGSKPPRPTKEQLEGRYYWDR